MYFLYTSCPLLLCFKEAGLTDGFQATHALICNSLRWSIARTNGMLLMFLVAVWEFTQAFGDVLTSAHSPLGIEGVRCPLLVAVFVAAAVFWGTLSLSNHFYGRPVMSTCFSSSFADFNGIII
jgi:hypothetical protein